MVRCLWGVVVGIPRLKGDKVTTLNRIHVHEWLTGLYGKYGM